jgi:hypothetical protein
MTRVRKLNRLGMELKAAGKIAKFQVINRKGQPILQTGAKNQNYADYKGDEDETETVDNTPWTLVESRRKRPHPENTLTSPNSRPLMADRTQNTQPAPTAATWAALTEQEYPEITRQSHQTATQPQRHTQKTAADSHKPPAASQPKKPEPASRKANQQPEPSGDRDEAPRGSQPGSYPVSRASSRHNSRPSTPPPIRSIFDEDRSETVRKNLNPKPQRPPKTRVDQHQDHLRKDY